MFPKFSLTPVRPSRAENSLGLTTTILLVILLWLMPGYPFVGAQAETPAASVVPSATDNGLTGSVPGAKPTPTLTPNIPETVNAIAAATDTALAVASFSPTPNVQTLVAATFAQRATRTALATQGLLVTPTVGELSRTPTRIASIAANAQWTPVVQAFNGVEMVLVPPGCFTMGVNLYTAHICSDQPFWIDRYEVTNEQFARLGGRAALPSKWPESKRPREQITWFESRAFCAQRGARLPTEAEWEYAARGPDNLFFPWGNTFIPANTVFSGNADSPDEVGSRRGGASWVGAYDLSGNVWEWTSSLFRPYPYNPTDGREDPDDTRSERVIRGGSWFVAWESLRAIHRDADRPASSVADRGLRCVCDT